MFKRMKNILVVLTLGTSVFLLQSCATPPTNRLYAQGQAAYHAEDYHTAFLRLLAAAKGNNPQAQYAVGYMYYYGIGTQRDTAQTLIWFKKAAAFGNYRATYAMQAIEKGVPKALESPNKTIQNAARHSK